MNAPVQKFISCGMYAFTENLREAWQLLFDEFLKNYSSKADIDPTINFDCDFSVLRDSKLSLGHTCGYPLMRLLKDDLVPVCAPIFEVEGCQQQRYSSIFIVPANSAIQTLAECRDKVVVINGEDSNSGMNVLRHAMASLNPNGAFFSEVRVSGSHYASLVDVADSKAQLAAIDCVSFALFKDEWPELVAKVRSIGFSEPSCGLPFVMPKADIGITHPQEILKALNAAVKNMPDQMRNRLHLKGFAAVDLDNYQSIIDIESFAQQAGYPTIN